MIEDLGGESGTAPPLAPQVWAGPGRLLAIALGALVALSIVVPMAGLPSRQLVTFTPPATVVLDRVGNVITLPTDTRVWRMLEQRPVRLPDLGYGAACPTSSVQALAGSATGLAAGGGPIYAVTGGSAIGLGRSGDDGLRGGKLLWVARPEYQGPALIRGVRLDGHADVKFDGGAAKLRFDLDTHVRAGDDKTGSVLGWRYLPSTVYVPEPGCYGFQIDLPDTTVWLILATSS